MTRQMPHCDGKCLNPRRPVRRHAWILLAFGFLATLSASGCGNSSGSSQAPKVAEVVLTEPAIEEVTDYQEFTGRLESCKTVEVRAHVTGYIDAAPFKEGDKVRAGDLLFQIDPRTFRADLNQAEANLNQAIADRKFQERSAERARLLNSQNSGAIKREEFDQIMAALEKAQATVVAMEAARDRAKVYLDYTRVVASQDGRISRRFLDPGNLAKADDTLLTTIVAEDPMYAYFDVDERTYLDLVGGAVRSQAMRVPIAELQVQMRLVNEDQFTRTGAVNFIDNRVVGNTGTIRMRGVFANADGYLKPGLFVRMRLPTTKPYKALVVAEEALLSDQGRRYVYVVNENNEAVYRAVKLGQAIHGMRVVRDGLKERERVILSGMQRVRPGAKVEPKVDKALSRASGAQRVESKTASADSASPAAAQPAEAAPQRSETAPDRGATHAVPVADEKKTKS
jgi:membrane fusion protein, multidrug efflux system